MQFKSDLGCLVDFAAHVEFMSVEWLDYITPEMGQEYYGHLEHILANEDFYKEAIFKPYETESIDPPAGTRDRKAESKVFGKPFKRLEVSVHIPLTCDEITVHGNDEPTEKRRLENIEYTYKKFQQEVDYWGSLNAYETDSQCIYIEDVVPKVERNCVNFSSKRPFLICHLNNKWLCELQGMSGWKFWFSTESRSTGLNKEANYYYVTEVLLED